MKCLDGVQLRPRGGAWLHVGDADEDDFLQTYICQIEGLRAFVGLGIGLPELSVAADLHEDEVIACGFAEHLEIGSTVVLDDVVDERQEHTAAGAQLKHT
jgi:hypothetical protein